MCIKTTHSWKYRSGKGWAGDVNTLLVLANAMGAGVVGENSENRTPETTNAWQVPEGKGFKRKEAITGQKNYKRKKAKKPSKKIILIRSKQMAPNNTEQDEKMPKNLATRKTVKNLSPLIDW